MSILLVCIQLSAFALNRYNIFILIYFVHLFIL